MVAASTSRADLRDAIARLRKRGATDSGGQPILAVEGDVPRFQRIARARERRCDGDGCFMILPRVKSLRHGNDTVVCAFGSR